MTGRKVVWGGYSSAEGYQRESTALEQGDSGPRRQADSKLDLEETP